MFSRFGRNLKDYHDLYLKCDALLLADVFEKFRINSLKNYLLCPSHYLSVPALRCDAMLNMTKIKVELISDLDLIPFLEKSMRGKVSYTSNRSSKTSNKYLKFYDPKQESKHIIYLDENNFYGYAMSKFLPKSGFKGINPKEFALNKLLTIVRKGVFLKLILNILKSYENYTLIFL